MDLKVPGAILDFTVAMNTDRVNLSWNLAAHAALTPDTGPAGGGHPAFDGRTGHLALTPGR